MIMNEEYTDDPTAWLEECCGSLAKLQWSGPMAEMLWGVTARSLSWRQVPVYCMVERLYDENFVRKFKTDLYDLIVNVLL